MKKLVFPGLTLVLFGLALTGCPKAKGPTPEAAVAEPTEVATPVASGVPTVDVGSDWGTAPGFLDTVTFHYMKAELTAESRASLKKNAGVLKTILKASSGVKIRVEGHCDDRGTLEYNMALGQRRAKVVRDYYATLGISKSALDTISYGEERPLCTEMTEDCWARNRRSETTLKSATPVQIPLPK
ncbi:MAG: OmpA family protein [Elusimicrobia bacterium]|nr:OmpA family protein [Elusimicrobiota bacterium]